MKDISQYLTTGNVCLAVILASTVWLGSNLVDFEKAKSQSRTPLIQEANRLYGKIEKAERHSDEARLATTEYSQFLGENPQLEKDYQQSINQLTIARNKGLASCGVLLASSLFGLYSKSRNKSYQSPLETKQLIIID